MSNSRRSPIPARSAAAIAVLVALAAGCASPPPDPAPPADEPLGPPMPFVPCVGEAIEMDASAWRDHARDLRELILLHEPSYEALATLGTTMRVAATDRRERRMRWLLEHDPARLDVDGDAAAFREFEWTAEDAAALAAADPSVAELGSRAEELAAQYGRSPGLQLFVEWYNSELVQTADYRAALADLTDRERAIGRQLARCLPPEDDDAPEAPVDDDAGDQG